MNIHTEFGEIKFKPNKEDHELLEWLNQPYAYACLKGNLEDAMRQAVFEQQKLVGKEKADHRAFASERAFHRWFFLGLFREYIRPQKRGRKEIKGFTFKEAQKLEQILLEWIKTDRLKKVLAYEICKAFSPLYHEKMSSSSVLTTAKQIIETRGLAWEALSTFQNKLPLEFPLNETRNADD